MPRRVDHHARRSQLADALMRVAATRGPEEVSLRHVAAEAGVTSGMVQHYFRTKDEMMTFALDVVRDRVERRMAADPPPDGASPRARVRALLVQLLPLDEEREREAHVALAFHAYAAVRPAVAAHLQPDTADVRAELAAQLRTAGRVADPDTAATALLALVEGLALHVLGGHVAAAHAIAVLEDHLDRVL